MIYPKFDIKKTQRQLNKINKENGIDLYAGIQIIINQMIFYNELVDNLEITDKGKSYMFLQLSPQIFNQLKQYGITPEIVKNKEESTGKADKFLIITDTINKLK